MHGSAPRAQKALDLDSDDDLTIVATAQAPDKVLVFDSATLGDLVPAVVDGSYAAFRHAADLGDVTFKASFLSVLFPSADPIWEKGDQYLTAIAGGVVSVAVTRPDESKPLASSTVQAGGPDLFTRIEFIVVGTKGRNARLVTIVRDIIDI